MIDSAPYEQSSEGLSASKKRPAVIPVPLGEKDGPKRIALDPVGGQHPGGVFKKFDSDGEESDSPVEETAPRSASPESDGSGGGQDAGSSGNETAPPSTSPVSDGSGGGEETGSKTVSGKEPEEQQSDTEVEKQLWCRVGKHIKGCTCPCSPHEHTPNCKCFETADGLDNMMEYWGNSQKHWARELIRDRVHLLDSDDEQ